MESNRESQLTHHNQKNHHQRNMTNYSQTENRRVQHHGILGFAEGLHQKYHCTP